MDTQRLLAARKLGMKFDALRDRIVAEVETRMDIQALEGVRDGEQVERTHLAQALTNRATGTGELGGPGRSRTGCGYAGPIAWCRVPPGTQPERGRGWTGEALLRRLQDKLHNSGRSTTEDPPRRPQIGCWPRGYKSLIARPDINSNPRQAPQQSLPFTLSSPFTISPTSRGIER